MFIILLLGLVAFVSAKGEGEHILNAHWEISDIKDDRNCTLDVQQCIGTNDCSGQSCFGNEHWAISAPYQQCMKLFED